MCLRDINKSIYSTYVFLKFHRCYNSGNNLEITLCSKSTWFENKQEVVKIISKGRWLLNSCPFPIRENILDHKILTFKSKRLFNRGAYNH